MICTFGDLTDVIWWRELRPADPADHRLRRPPPRPTPPGVDADAGRRRLRASWPARPCQQAAGAHRRAAARVRRPGRRAAADHPPGEVLREGRPPARDRHHAASGTSATAAATPTCASALLARGRELDWHPAHMRRPLRELGRRPQRRLADQPPALLRRAVPGLVPRSTPTASPTTTHPHRCPTRRALPVDPSHRRARRATPRTSAASPAASSATPTSWTPGPRRR